MKRPGKESFVPLSPFFLIGLVLAWEMIVLVVSGHADDCGRYLQNPASLVVNPRTLVEDCMRTGYGQAIATGLAAGIGGGAVANAVARRLRGVPPAQPPSS